LTSECKADQGFGKEALPGGLGALGSSTSVGFRGFVHLQESGEEVCRSWSSANYPTMYVERKKTTFWQLMQNSALMGDVREFVQTNEHFEITGMLTSQMRPVNEWS